ncbi:bifunctional lysylphosphatidylglycerol flippase/synthetase MprF [Actinomadura litoris]|uniref:DUF2156 domain-containing protein n=1 Tax=Actinomadura litoris TaxID=2678616 RepID=A0A7K1LCB1_9ACTN|nr:phosphatidylglycerol lysyltransferase domain-containing protein [Actinomadura litoris]MUN41896.1 DUF2156 domain-containing protein [Actinomadura litoris]
MPDPADRPVLPLAAATAAVAALVAVPATGAPRWLDRLSLLATGRPLAAAHAVLLALVFALVARGVLLRRRAAWYGLLALVSAGLLAVLAGEDAPWRLPPLVAALAALWTLRDRFTVRPHPKRVRAAVRAGASLTLAATVLLGGASWLPGVLGMAGLLVLVGMLLAPAPAPPPGDDAERALVARLVARSGSDTLAPFALRRDKTYVFSPDGRAAIGYRVMFGMAVAGGDPVGDPGSREAAVRAFLALCRRTGWRPAVLGAGTALLPAWAPLRSFGYGDEVVVHPSGFTLAGRPMRNVRQAVARTANAGVTSEIVAERDLSPDLRAALLDVASRSLGGAAERGFSMNLDELLTGHHPGALVAVAYGPDGPPIAFQRYVTSGRAVSLDAMRRAPGAPNGVNELLIVEMIGYASEHGHDPVSLNFAAFRALLDSRDRSVPQKLGYQALHLLDPLIAVESLYLFDKKFRPAYEPRSIVFRSWFDIGRLAAALLTLEFAPPRRTGAPLIAGNVPVHGGTRPAPMAHQRRRGEGDPGRPTPPPRPRHTGPR